MLDVQVSVTAINPGRSLRTRIVIGNIGGGAISNYRVVERDPTGNQLREALLENYPRWSEPVGGLIARAIKALWAQADEDQTSGTVMDAKLDARVGTKPVFAWCVYFQESYGALEVWVDGSPLAPQEFERPLATRWRQLASAANVFATFGVHELPPWPEPVRVPIRQTASFAYVRVQEIPEPARSAFVRRIYHSTVPVIEGEGPCAYAWDFDDFLNGCR